MVEGNTTSDIKKLRCALQTFKPKYRKILLRTLKKEEINRICEYIKEIFKDNTPNKEVRESFSSIVKLNCFCTTNDHINIENSN